MSEYEIIFKLDKDGVLEETGAPFPGAPFQSVIIEQSCAIPAIEIKKMAANAKQLRADDEMALRRVQVRDKLCDACYQNRADVRMAAKSRSTLMWLHRNPDASEQEMQDILEQFP